ncbi:MAG TPA: preprotein translocase subunit Sec61beta [Thermoprotei archaeon]|nr:preprotein translocase subunit Sec61beta [Thermoprotei archaeon]
MSQRRRREAPMPASTAGLLRFFEDSRAGISINPVYLVLSTIVFVAISLAIRYLFPVA